MYQRKSHFSTLGSEMFNHLINFPGSRRLSVGALVGLGTLLKSDTPKKAAKPTVASSYGSTAGITQGGVTKIRNKTIPIINPMVKSGQWPGTSYKKGTIFSHVIIC